MDEPTLDDLYEAFTLPFISPVSLDFAAAHLLARGADGPALRELAGLSARDFHQALELVPVAIVEAEAILAPARQRQEALASSPVALDAAVVVAWDSMSIGLGIDDLAAFVDALAKQVKRAGIGEIDGLIDDGDEQVLICYSDDLPVLRSFLKSHLAEAPVPPHRVELRPAS